MATPHPVSKDRKAAQDLDVASPTRRLPRAPTRRRGSKDPKAGLARIEKSQTLQDPRVVLPEPARKSQVQVVAAVLEPVAETVQVLGANGLRIPARD